MGRTGTLITIDVELQRAMKEGVVDPFYFVAKMREQRNLMVQTEVCKINMKPTLGEAIKFCSDKLGVYICVHKYAVFCLYDCMPVFVSCTGPVCVPP